MITVSTSKSYHHGDLRSALVEAGLKALEVQDIGEISLRQLAREVGVSPTAVYRHFPDKSALMRALAETGIEQMAAWQKAAAQGVDKADAFAATGRAYVRWALANPALFRLAFGECDQISQTVFGQNEAAQMLRAFAEDFTGSEAETQRLMLQAWAVVHGLAMLILDGQLPRDEALIDQVIDARTLFRA
ncbi:MAG: TetR/AcrR family transcriptional regulator [Sphingomonadales bacterium]|nr:TetR/AcrR family transcriptional regulator [Sphingomonadales bacterium]